MKVSLKMPSRCCASVGKVPLPRIVSCPCHLSAPELPNVVAGEVLCVAERWLCHESVGMLNVELSECLLTLYSPKLARPGLGPEFSSPAMLIVACSVLLAWCSLAPGKTWGSCMWPRARAQGRPDPGIPPEALCPPRPDTGSGLASCHLMG